MPVTNYYTVNGELIGEKTTGGSQVDYLTDALGSVTATLNQSAQVVNTYRYKPYGALLAKTGVGSDPAFGWVGSQGYRQAGRKFSDFYVRARHYDSSAGRWSTKDMVWLKPWRGSFYYANSSPVTLVDPSGYLDCGVEELLFRCPLTCGPRIQDPLVLTLRKIRTVFDSVRPSMRKALCLNLISLSDLKAFNAWDIVDLSNKIGPATYVFDTDQYHKLGCTLGRCCESTVYVGGQCHKAYNVNYIMFGLIWNLCGRDKISMNILIRLNKIRYFWDEVNGAIEWANAGFDGWPRTRTPYSTLTNFCKPCSATLPGTSSQPGFQVHWDPLDNF